MIWVGIGLISLAVSIFVSVRYFCKTMIKKDISFINNVTVQKGVGCDHREDSYSVEKPKGISDFVGPYDEAGVIPDLSMLNKTDVETNLSVTDKNIKVSRVGSSAKELKRLKERK